MTLTELRAFIQDLGLNDNAKVVILVGYDRVTEEYYVVQVDANGNVGTV